MYKAKYIRTRNNEIIVFSELIKHSEFADFQPVSAGFISIGAEPTSNNGYFKTICTCYGESTSLNLKSKCEEDSAIANKQILNNVF